MGSRSYCHRWRTCSPNILVLSYRLCVDADKMEIQIDPGNAGEFTLTAKDSSRYPLVHLKVLKGRELLGVYIVVDGNKRHRKGI